MPTCHRAQRLALAIAAVLSLAASACGGGSGSPANGAVDGHYSGSGVGVQSIEFDVSGGGTSIASLKASLRVACAAGVGSSSQYQGFTDPDSIAVSSGAFTDSYQQSLGSGVELTVDVSGSLDGHGGASGLVKYTDAACDAPAEGAPWSAALPGVSPPPLPSASAPTSASPSCAPQPCGVTGSVVVSVDDVSQLAETGGSVPVVVGLTFVNKGSRDDSINGSFGLHLDPAQGTSIPAPSSANLVDADGNPVDCISFLQLPAGQTVSGHSACFFVPAAEASQTFTLRVAANGAIKSVATLDLGALPPAG